MKDMLSSAKPARVTIIKEGSSSQHKVSIGSADGPTVSFSSGKDKAVNSESVISKNDIQDTVTETDELESAAGEDVYNNDESDNMNSVEGELTADENEIGEDENELTEGEMENYDGEFSSEDEINTEASEDIENVDTENGFDDMEIMNDMETMEGMENMDIMEKMGGMEDGYMDPGFMGEFGAEIGVDDAGASFKPMSSWGFVIGIYAACLAVGIGLGILFAKLKARKGLNVYED